MIARLGFPFPYGVHGGEAFAFQEDDDCARLPYRLVTEVETIRYVGMHTQLPVARIYVVDNDPSNPVGATYTLQQYLEGDVLAERWFPLSADDHTQILQAIGAAYGQILALKFDAFGSLSSHTAKDPIGPFSPPLATVFRSHDLADVGPWPASEPFAPLMALATREVSWLNDVSGRTFFKAMRQKLQPAEDSDQALNACIALAEGWLKIIPHLSSLFPLPTSAQRPTLSHADFHFGNILVSRKKPTELTGIVDWEFSSVLPLWCCSTIPSILVDIGDTYETDPVHRKEKARWREVFGKAVVEACPDADIIYEPRDKVTQASLRGLRLLFSLIVESTTLTSPLTGIQQHLTEIRECMTLAHGHEYGIQATDETISVFSSYV
ncbi:hypothetical protein BV25DRAFT_1820503 [Artomyces pyxidatus]|uniref:Uncharacterized protein n=1 Tax=Artomyces pyxidatus TaxID=48021 RepID=A0ACB8TDN0_9AGAM|nr:hypothetical protein BV25DRAFT_1820503 [Artomyces pyxidatus]